MKILKIWCQIVLSWVKSLFITAYKLREVEEYLPKMLSPTSLYIVQEDGFHEYAAMICPCGCGEILYMNLIPDERPTWKLIQHFDGTVSLHPSIWRKKGCQSHFWLINSTISWSI